MGVRRWQQFIKTFSWFNYRLMVSFYVIIMVKLHNSRAPVIQNTTKLETEWLLFPKLVVLNDKNRTIFNLKYCKGFLILVLGKRMEILYYFKPFDTKIIIRQVDYFLFLLAISSKYNFFHLFLIAVVNLVRKQLLRFYGD